WGPRPRRRRSIAPGRPPAAPQVRPRRRRTSFLPYPSRAFGSSWSPWPPAWPWRAARDPLQSVAATQPSVMPLPKVPKGNVLQKSHRVDVNRKAHLRAALLIVSLLDAPCRLDDTLFLSF